MSTNRDDPRCPECGEPVSATSLYCMHCGADFGEPDSGESQAVTPDDQTATRDDEVAGIDDDVAGRDDDKAVMDVATEFREAVTGIGGEETATRSESATRSKPATGTGMPTTESDDGSDHLLDPDGLLDNSLTVLVGLVGGGLIGFLALLFFGMLLESAVVVVPIGLAWLGSTGYLATRRTVGESLRYGCYATAILLVLLPFVVFTDTTNGDLAGRIIFFVGAEVVLGLVALFLAGVGYLAGR